MPGAVLGLVLVTFPVLTQSIKYTLLKGAGFYFGSSFQSMTYRLPAKSRMAEEHDGKQVLRTMAARK